MVVTSIVGRFLVASYTSIVARSSSAERNRAFGVVASRSVSRRSETMGWSTTVTVTVFGTGPILARTTW